MYGHLFVLERISANESRFNECNFLKKINLVLIVYWLYFLIYFLAGRRSWLISRGSDIIVSASTWKKKLLQSFQTRWRVWKSYKKISLKNAKNQFSLEPRMKELFIILVYYFSTRSVNSLITFLISLLIITVEKYFSILNFYYLVIWRIFYECHNISNTKVNAFPPSFILPKFH